MGEDLDDDRDPLLVRPFVLPDGVQQQPPQTASTWPVEQTTGAQITGERTTGELPTQLLPPVPASGSAPAEPSGPGARRRRSLLLLLGAGVTSVAIVAGYAMLRPADRSGSWASLPGQSLPAAVGPATSASVTASSATTSGSAAGPVENGGAATSSSPVARPSPSTASTGSPAGTSASPSATASSGGSSSSSPTAAVPAPPINLAPPEAIATGSGLLVTGNGLCLDLRGGDAVENGDVHVDDCNGTSPQRWQLNPDRTLEVQDLCAYLIGDGTVDLTRCDGRTTAQWQLFEDGRLVNAATAQCLTDPHAGSRPGRPVVVTLCGGSNNQRWAFR